MIGFRTMLALDSGMTRFVCAACERIAAQHAVNQYASSAARA